jgi:hypothetical protein
VGAAAAAACGAGAGQKWWQRRQRQKRGFSHYRKRKKCTSILGVRVPRLRIGDNLAQIKAMRLENVQTFDPDVWLPNRVLSVPQIDFSAHTDRKMVNLYVYLGNLFTILQNR